LEIVIVRERVGIGMIGMILVINVVRLVGVRVVILIEVFLWEKIIF
jgi:hypothetical protein